MAIKFIILLHLLGAVGMGFYLLFPFFVNRISGLAESLQAGYINLLQKLNKLGQFLLIAQFLTGGYLIGKGSYSSSWMITVVVLFLAAGAFSAMLGKPLKRMQQDAGEGKSFTADYSKVRTFSMLIGITFLLMLIIMYDPTIL
jgi:uncharacterized membrane protein